MTPVNPPGKKTDDLVMLSDAKPRQKGRLRAARVLDVACAAQWEAENDKASNPAIARLLNEDEKHVRKLRDARKAIEVGELYYLPRFAVIALIDDVKKARGL